MTVLVGRGGLLYLALVAVMRVRKSTPFCRREEDGGGELKAIRRDYRLSLPTRVNHTNCLVNYLA